MQQQADFKDLDMSNVGHTMSSGSDNEKGIDVKPPKMRRFVKKRPKCQELSPDESSSDSECDGKLRDASQEKPYSPPGNQLDDKYCREIYDNDLEEAYERQEEEGD